MPLNCEDSGAIDVISIVSNEYTNQASNDTTTPERKLWQNNLFNTYYGEQWSKKVKFRVSVVSYVQKAQVMMGHDETS